MDIKELVDGFVTDEMRRAGADAMSEFDERFESRFDMVPDVLEAMLAAAPFEFWERVRALLREGS